jgi:hypothetical protein
MIYSAPNGNPAAVAPSSVVAISHFGIANGDVKEGRLSGLLFCHLILT